MIAAALALALAATPQSIQERLDEIAPLRPLRMLSHIPDLPPDIAERLGPGDIVTFLAASDTNTKKVYGLQVVDIPIARMWAAVIDDLARDEYTRVSHAIRLSGQDCTSGRRTFLFAPAPIIANRWWVATYRENIALRRRSEGRVREMAVLGSGDLQAITDPLARELVGKGIPIAFSEGSWMLTDLGGGETLVEFYVWTDPGGNIPAALRNSQAARTLSTSIEAMVQLARDGPACPEE